MSADYYRKCASTVVFRRAESGLELLLLHKPRKNDDWQISQGGIEEGESVVEAALREVQEEAGIEPQVLGESNLVYQYDFPASYRKERPDNVCGQKVQYVFAVLEDGEVTVDDEEIDDYAWVKVDEVSSYIHRPEYLEHIYALVDEGRALLY